MSRYTREDDRYWKRRPADHSVVGLFIGGPQEARPSLFSEVETGNAHRSTEAPSQVIARQQYERDQRRARINRQIGFVRAVLAPTPRQRRRRGFVHRAA